MCFVTHTVSDVNNWCSLLEFQGPRGQTDVFVKTKSQPALEHREAASQLPKNCWSWQNKAYYVHLYPKRSLNSIA